MSDMCHLLTSDWSNFGLRSLNQCSSSHRCQTFCYCFRVERYVSWKRCTTGFEIRFLLFGGCVKNVSPISSNVFKPHGIKETARTVGPSEVI